MYRAEAVAASRASLGPRASLRLRMSGWHALVIASTVTALTGMGIYEERRQLLETETAHAQALLSHLGHMPEFQGDRRTAASHVARMDGSLRAAGSALELIPEDAAASRRAGAHRVLATRRLALSEGAFELRFASDSSRLQAILLRAVRMHLLYGLAALAALVAGTEWILRRNLVAPLRSLSDQLTRMRTGGGWLPRIPPVEDAELAGLTSAVTDLGPALERQVYEWIEAEHRAAVALALNGIRVRLREPQDRIQSHRRGDPGAAPLLDGRRSGAPRDPRAARPHLPSPRGGGGREAR